MKINLKQLAKVEKDYESNPVALNSLQTMVSNVLTYWSLGDPPSASLSVAIDTLKELKILKTDEEKPVQQLNS